MILAGQVAVVTGASRGIGRSIAFRLAQAGAHVVVNYATNKEKALQVVAEISELGATEACAMAFDVANSTAVDAAFKNIVDKYGRLDILINNAGISIDGLLLRVKDDDIHSVMQTNLFGAMYCSRAALRPMLKNRYGRIVNISSVVGEMGNAGQTVYCAAKAGLVGFTKALAREVAKKSITVNAVSPGYIESDMTAVIPEGSRQEILRSIPMGMVGNTADIAEAVLFLSSEQSKYVSGQTLAVNGGMYM